MKSCLAGLALLGLTATGAAQQSVDSLVARFYARRWGQPAWLFNAGISPQARILLDRIVRSAADGLDSSEYLTPQLESLLQRHVSERDARLLDSALTRAFLSYAQDLSRGRVEPAAVDTQWTASPPALDLVAILDWAAAAADQEALLAAVEPPQPGYRALRAALARYQELAERGPWPAELAQRLGVEGYDTAQGLDAAVREFQQAHGLAVDGIVGHDTRGALDVSAAARAQQIALNLERWRWLPRALGERYILVNSAAFTLELVDHDTLAWTTRAIVGRTDWPTPIVNARATGLLFRPRWRVPRIIAARELLPLIQRDSAYLARERFRVFRDSAPGSPALDPSTIGWSQLAESPFVYQLVQEPGGDNPLGGVKLVFWNPFSVFIHDTPARPLFDERRRTFSHGCVRVEHAAELVARLLPNWSAKSIHAAMSQGEERWVRLVNPIDVHLVYWTAWPTADGRVAFADDPYGWDGELARALQTRALAAGRVSAPAAR